MADQDPNRDQQDRNVELPGDTESADIVDRTGEQMPRQSHDGLDSNEGESVRGDADEEDPDAES